MRSPLLPLSLAVCAVAADGGDRHRLAFYLILLAIPVAAAAALVAAGEVADGREGLVRAALSGVALALLVTSSAVRSNAAPSAPPALALSALVGCLCVYAALGLAWVLRAPRGSPAPERS